MVLFFFFFFFLGVCFLPTPRWARLSGLVAIKSNVLFYAYCPGGVIVHSRFRVIGGRLRLIDCLFES